MIMTMAVCFIST